MCGTGGEWRDHGRLDQDVGILAMYLWLTFGKVAIPPTAQIPTSNMVTQHSLSLQLIAGAKWFL